MADREKILFKSPTEVTLDSDKWYRKQVEDSLVKMIKNHSIKDRLIDMVVPACVRRRVVFSSVNPESVLYENFMLYPIEAAVFCRRYDLIEPLKKAGCRIFHYRKGPSVFVTFHNRKKEEEPEGYDFFVDGYLDEVCEFWDVDILAKYVCKEMLKGKAEADYLINSLNEEWKHVYNVIKNRFMFSLLNSMNNLTDVDLNERDGFIDICPDNEEVEGAELIDYILLQEKVLDNLEALLPEIYNYLMDDYLEIFVSDNFMFYDKLFRSKFSLRPIRMRTNRIALSPCLINEWMKHKISISEITAMPGEERYYLEILSNDIDFLCTHVFGYKTKSFDSDVEKLVALLGKYNANVSRYYKRFPDGDDKYIGWLVNVYMRWLNHMTITLLPEYFKKGRDKVGEIWQASLEDMYKKDIPIGKYFLYDTEYISERSMFLVWDWMLSKGIKGGQASIGDIKNRFFDDFLGGPKFPPQFFGGESFSNAYDWRKMAYMFIELYDFVIKQPSRLYKFQKHLLKLNDENLYRIAVDKGLFPKEVRQRVLDYLDESGNYVQMPFWIALNNS